MLNVEISIYSGIHKRRNSKCSRRGSDRVEYMSTRLMFTCKHIHRVKTGISKVHFYIHVRIATHGKTVLSHSYNVVKCHKH